jgi:hypothetical protein
MDSAESWNGTSWSSIGTMGINAASNTGSTSGSTTSHIMVGGNSTTSNVGTGAAQVYTSGSITKTVTAT